MKRFTGRLSLVFILLLMLFTAQLAQAHEMGTSALVLHEQQAGSGLFVFKRTVGADGKVPPIDFSFSPACELRNVNTEWEEESEVVQRGSFHCGASLQQHQIISSGFTRLSPELIVLATPLNSERIHKVLNPGNTELQLAPDQAAAVTSGSLPAYLLIGIEHIVFGLDHVLFVTGLYLLWRKRRQSVKQLFGQFTLFTVGHSLTLGLLVLGWITVPARAIEAWIALSVLWLAWELIRQEPAHQSNGNALSHLLLIAAFGLLHGSGFALSMEERGFPEGELFTSLLWFNLGIELGQLWIITLLVSLFSILQKANYHTALRLAQYTLTLGMGGAALYWTVDRIHSYV